MGEAVTYGCCTVPGSRQVPASPLLWSTFEHNNSNHHYYLLRMDYDA